MLPEVKDRFYIFSLLNNCSTVILSKTDVRSSNILSRITQTTDIFLKTKLKYESASVIQFRQGQALCVPMNHTD